MKVALALCLVLPLAACGGLPYVGGLPFEEGPAGDAGDGETGIRGIVPLRDAGDAAETAAAVDAGPDASDPPPEHDAGSGAETSAPPPVDASGPACAMAYEQASCETYMQGMIVSAQGHNWLCSNGMGVCWYCGQTGSCAPGASGCPWGQLWMDQGTCAGTPPPATGPDGCSLVTHQTGAMACVQSTFADCEPSYSRALAQDACTACGEFTKCGDLIDCADGISMAVCGQVTMPSAGRPSYGCWAFTGPLAGFVHVDTTDQCPTTADPRWQ